MRPLLCLTFFISAATLGQQVKEYYNADDELISPEKSRYYNVGKKNARGYFYDSVKSFYTSSNKLMALAVCDQSGNRIGNYQSFYLNGKLKLKGRYERKNFRIFNSSMDSTDFIIVEFFDSTGRQQVHNGNGMISGRVERWKETGRLVNGLRDSVWTTWYDNGKVFSHESWHEGELVDGISYDVDGKEYYYKQRIDMPEPVGGMTKFFEEVSEKMRYPEMAEKRGIEGKINVEFVVEKNGTISSPRAIDHLGFGCDEEAVRVLMLSPAWKPALRKGQPARHRMVVPFLFKLT
jgi:TonB family protein